MFTGKSAKDLAQKVVLQIFSDFKERWSYIEDDTLLEIINSLGDPESRPRGIQKVLGQNLILLAEAFVDAKQLTNDLIELEEQNEN